MAASSYTSSRSMQGPHPMEPLPALIQTLKKSLPNLEMENSIFLLYYVPFLDD